MAVFCQQQFQRVAGKFHTGPGLLFELPIIMSRLLNSVSWRFGGLSPVKTGIPNSFYSGEFLTSAVNLGSRSDTLNNISLTSFVSCCIIQRAHKSQPF